MSSERPPVLFPRGRRRSTFRYRGEIYSWLRAYHALIAPRLERGDLTWPILCVEMSRHGVTSRGGAAPTQRAAAKAWQTVCRDLEAEGVPDPPGRRLNPSRLPKDWRPPSAPGPAGPAAEPRPATPDPYDVRKALASLRRIMNERSGRKE
jgi:hypothetical protein